MRVEKKTLNHPRSSNLLSEYTECEALNDAKGKDFLMKSTIKAIVPCS